MPRKIARFLRHSRARRSYLARASMSRREPPPEPRVRARLARAFGPCGAASVSACEWFWICMSRRAPCLCAADRRRCFPFIRSHRRQRPSRCTDPLPVQHTGFFRKAMSLNALDRPRSAARCGGGGTRRGSPTALERRPYPAVRFDRPSRTRQGSRMRWMRRDGGLRPPAPARLSFGYLRTNDAPPAGGPSTRSREGGAPAARTSSRVCYLVDPASSHMLVSKIKPCMCKYEQIQTVKLRMAH